MKIHYRLLLIAIFAFFSLTTNAQGKKVEERAALRMQKIDEICDLTEQQQEQVKQLFISQITETGKTQNKPELKSQKIGETSLKEKIATRQSTINSELELILGSERFAILKASRTKK